MLIKSYESYKRVWVYIVCGNTVFMGVDNFIRDRISLCNGFVNRGTKIYIFLCDIFKYSIDLYNYIQSFFKQVGVKVIIFV